MSAKNGVPLFHGKFWSESGPDARVADLMSASVPYLLAIEELSPHTTRAIAELDAEMLDGLAEIGFSVDLGRGDSGMYSIALARAGGYYIDKGNAQLLIDGEVKLQRGEIRAFTPTGVVYRRVDARSRYRGVRDRLG